jgi:hypothetical protein
MNDSFKSSFGRAHFKIEGEAIHPDDTLACMTDEQRRAQALAYFKACKAHGIPDDVLSQESYYDEVKDLL